MTSLIHLSNRLGNCTPRRTSTSRTSAYQMVSSLTNYSVQLLPWLQTDIPQPAASLTGTVPKFLVSMMMSKELAVSRWPPLWPVFT